jgi:hypothetical protein
MRRQSMGFAVWGAVGSFDCQKENSFIVIIIVALGPVISYFGI